MIEGANGENLGVPVVQDGAACDEIRLCDGEAFHTGA